jgi:hypothetical protein
MNSPLIKAIHGYPGRRDIGSYQYDIGNCQYLGIGSEWEIAACGITVSVIYTLI